MKEKLEVKSEVETLEANPESIVETLEGDRQKFLGKIISSRIVERFGNWLPGFNVVKLGVETAIGSALSGRKLTGKERLVHGLEAGALMIVYGVIAEQLRGQGVSGSMLEAAALSKFTASAADLYLKKEIISGIFSSFAQSHPAAGIVFEKIVQAMQYLPDNLFYGKPIQLNLNI